MSVLSRNGVQVDVTGTRERAVAAAKQAGPLVQSAAKQAGPLAQSAGRAAMQGTENVVIWVTPHVDKARAWAAPQIERGGIAVQETVAPRVSEAMVTFAHKLDTAPARRRRWPRILGSVALLAAAGGAAAAVILRRRQDALAYEPPLDPVGGVAPDDPSLADPGTEADVNGQLARS